MDLFNDLFNDIWNDFGVFGAPTIAKEEKRCPVCGRTFSEFRRTGRLGCGECYRTFRPAMRETLRQIHSNSRHNGKIPSKSGEELKKKRQLEDLKEKLRDAVKHEDYETAAALHKQIREMEG
ncbi:MAG: UvrB/UvrC motif-containing protein [Clostridia bacterium]|nr:UvrB/UvrC motif-containing protein [Clostridia bacterium]